MFAAAEWGPRGPGEAGPSDPERASDPERVFGNHGPLTCRGSGSTLFGRAFGPPFFFARPTMLIRVLFFASYRELLGSGELFLEVQEPATVSDLLQGLWDRGDPFLSLPAAPVVAVNREFATLGTGLKDGDEVAFVPPVAGG